jgi:hypothetical protein
MKICVFIAVSVLKDVQLELGICKNQPYFFLKPKMNQNLEISEKQVIAERHENSKYKEKVS